MLTFHGGHTEVAPSSSTIVSVDTGTYKVEIMRKSRRCALVRPLRVIYTLYILWRSADVISRSGVTGGYCVESGSMDVRSAKHGSIN
jgi:hypothetical protein